MILTWRQLDYSNNKAHTEECSNPEEECSVHRDAEHIFRYVGTGLLFSRHLALVLVKIRFVWSLCRQEMCHIVPWKLMKGFEEMDWSSGWRRAEIQGVVWQWSQSLWTVGHEYQKWCMERNVCYLGEGLLRGTCWAREDKEKWGGTCWEVFGEQECCVGVVKTF
jgi:hypothetical protein